MGTISWAASGMRSRAASRMNWGAVSLEGGDRDELGGSGRHDFLVVVTCLEAALRTPSS
jgi:hypothetical protein